MLTIWKYEVAISDLFTIKMPRGAKLLSVQDQSGIPRLWALVDPENSHVRRGFRVFGTGHPVPPDTGAFVGTFLHLDGELVFHFFDQGEEPTA